MAYCPIARMSHHGFVILECLSGNISYFVREMQPGSMMTRAVDPSSNSPVLGCLSSVMYAELQIVFNNSENKHVIQTFV